MDVSIAKTLVSLTLVLAIVIFSLVSIEMLVSKVVRDFKAVWAERAPAAEAPRSE